MVLNKIVNALSKIVLYFRGGHAPPLADAIHEQCSECAASSRSSPLASSGERRR